MINGLPVVTAPAEIDVITAEKLRTVLLEAAENGHATIVVDLTGTRFCDSSGLNVLAAAHRRAENEGGELRLALPTSGTVTRVLAITALNRVIPCFNGLDQALTAPRSSQRPRGFGSKSSGQIISPRGATAANEEPMPATGHEYNWTISLRRTPVRPGNSDPGSNTFEIICRICGDDPALNHQEVSAELQRIRGPYTLSSGITAFTTHNEFHCGTGDMQPRPT
jgi:anti-anti-sigma factor